MRHIIVPAYILQQALAAVVAVSARYRRLRPRDGGIPVRIVRRQSGGYVLAIGEHRMQRAALDIIRTRWGARIVAL